jgi:hypothetical protein
VRRYIAGGCVTLNNDQARPAASRWRPTRLTVTQENYIMQRKSIWTSFVATLLFLAMPSIAGAEDFTKPTREHEAMAYEVGTWDADVSMWMSPDAEPMKSKAVEKNEMLGKMWLMSQFEAEFDGEKFTGRSALGYDPIKKKYVGGWVDSMSPFMMRMEGDYEVGAHTLTMIGEGTDVMTGKPAKHKMVTEYEEDKKTFTMYRQADSEGEDEWQKTMEIKFTRRK